MNFLDFFWKYSFSLWCIPLHFVKYEDSTIKCLNMRAKTKSVWWINEIFLCIFTNIWKFNFFYRYHNYLIKSNKYRLNKTHIQSMARVSQNNPAATTKESADKAKVNPGEYRDLKHRFKCHGCNRSYDSKIDLTQHNALIHAQRHCIRVRPIPGMIPIPGTDTRYRYLYKKNRYEPGIGIGSIWEIWEIWGISVSVQYRYGGYRYR